MLKEVPRIVRVRSAFSELPHSLHLLSLPYNTLRNPVDKSSMIERIVFSIRHAPRGILIVKNQKLAYYGDDSIDDVTKVFLLHLNLISHF